MTNVERILVNQFEYTAAEAHEIQIEMANRVLDGESPEEVLADYEIESDYVLDIL